PRRTGHVRPRPAQRNRPALPERPRPAPRAPHADRHHADPGQAQRNLRPRPLRAQAVTWVIRQGVSSKRLTSGNTPKINLARKLGLVEAQSCDDESDHETCVVAGVAVRADTEIADATQQFVGIHAGANLARRRSMSLP